MKAIRFPRLSREHVLQPPSKGSSMEICEARLAVKQPTQNQADTPTYMDIFFYQVTGYACHESVEKTSLTRPAPSCK